MKNLFLIIGAPGSGKTTDASLIAQQSGGTIAHYSTGDLLRDEIKRGTNEGTIIESYTSQGLIVPIEIAIKTITTAINNAQEPIILFDGYPRSIEQMNALYTYLQNSDTVKLIDVIEVYVDEATAKERVLGRARGADDDIEVFNRRMRVYLEPLSPIRDFYASKGLLSTIDGSGDINTVVDAMHTHITNKLNTKD